MIRVLFRGGIHDGASESFTTEPRTRKKNVTDDTFPTFVYVARDGSGHCWRYCWWKQIDSRTALYRLAGWVTISEANRDGILITVHQ